MNPSVPWFLSQAQQLFMPFQFIKLNNLLLDCKKNKNKQKEAHMQKPLIDPDVSFTNMHI